MAIQNLFGELANDISIKSLIQKFGRFSFGTDSSLRVLVSGALSSVSTITTVSTVTTANSSIGDTGKNSTAIQTSMGNFHNSVGRNIIRN